MTEALECWLAFGYCVLLFLVAWAMGWRPDHGWMPDD